MGGVRPGGEKRTFVGESEADSEGPATLDAALRSAADKAVDTGFVRQHDDGDPESGPRWFDLTGLEVAIANQHIKTMRVIVTER